MPPFTLCIPFFTSSSNGSSPPSPISSFTSSAHYTSGKKLTSWYFQPIIENMFVKLDSISTKLNEHKQQFKPPPEKGKPCKNERKHVCQLKRFVSQHVYVTKLEPKLVIYRFWVSWACLEIRRSENHMRFLLDKSGVIELKLCSRQINIAKFSNKNKQFRVAGLHLSCRGVSTKTREFWNIATNFAGFDPAETWRSNTINNMIVHASVFGVINNDKRWGKHIYTVYVDTNPYWEIIRALLNSKKNSLKHIRNVAWTTHHSGTMRINMRRMVQ